MKIRCSGELYAGSIDTKDCLACATKLKNRQPCGYSLPLLGAMFFNQQDRRESVHVTDLTQCLLKSYYSKVEPTAPYVHELLNMFIGVAVHSYIENHHRTDVEAEVPVAALGVVGTADVIIGDTLMDFKTTRSIGPGLPYGSHAEQLEFYRAMLDEDGKKIDQLHVQYIDMGGPPICRVCRVPLRFTNSALTCPRCGHVSRSTHVGAKLVSIPTSDVPEVKERLQERSRMLAFSIENKMPPVAEPGWICKYCQSLQCESNPLFGVDDDVVRA